MRENCAPYSITLITTAELALPQQLDIRSRTIFRAKADNEESRCRDRGCVRMTVLLPFLQPISLRFQLPATLSPSPKKPTVKCALVDIPRLVGTQVRQLAYPPPRNRNSRTCYRTFSKSPQAPSYGLCGSLNIAAVSLAAATKLAAIGLRSSGGNMGGSGASGSRVSWTDVLCTGSGTEDNR